MVRFLRNAGVLVFFFLAVYGAAVLAVNAEPFPILQGILAVVFGGSILSTLFLIKDPD